MKQNLLRPEPTLLPADPAAPLIEEGASPHEVARQHPASSLPWALLSEQAFAERDDVAAYAYARTGYHRGLDALRRAGWRGAGPIPFDHLPNQGFLRALMALGKAAAAIGEDDEAERIVEFLSDADPSIAPKSEQ
ncbi:Protein of unknown function [Bowdeniella nasicola]|uniref:DUF3151 domain-containing protein n=1 Tax=Bowdeniella nasicola TaxID=208480 RepID=A0A1H3XTG4_9ACTO|nr:DUF3151 domain-containing protein [Bowdeniella nasicola]SEA01818.1 Protein of unknown function [Bowdeniella nasicola]